MTSLSLSLLATWMEADLKQMAVFSPLLGRVNSEIYEAACSQSHRWTCVHDHPGFLTSLQMTWDQF
jgi:hypothetical protein